MRPDVRTPLMLALTLALTAAPALPAPTADFADAPADLRTRDNPYRSPADLSDGQSLFLAHCAGCHGAGGEGSGPIPSLRQRVIRQAGDGELFWYLTTGSANGDMPAWVALPEPDRWRIVAYLKTLPELPVARVADRPDPRVVAAKLSAPPPTAPFTDFRYEHPGVVRHIRVQDLPAPYATPAAANAPRIVARPQGTWPQVPHGFRVGLFAEGLDTPRVIRVAPNGDVFVAETGRGRIRVYRGQGADGKPLSNSVFASHLNRPYGIAFYPQHGEPRWVYVADTHAVRRYPYRGGDLESRGAPETLITLGSDQDHWTRDIVFSADDRTLYLAVGSASNDDEADNPTAERNRANILAYDADGGHERVHAAGLRNPSGLAIDPRDGRLWCSVNERDGLGDDLVPDYVTAVKEGGFYGWPWWYVGGFQDPRHPGEHPELQARVVTPDVLVQPHSAPLQLAFYDATQFPAAYRGDLFVALHGSWNRSVRGGYEVARIARHHTTGATGEYQDFMTGFVLPGGEVWGRPVGVAVISDGSLLVSDDASGTIWRVHYTGP